MEEKEVGWCHGVAVFLIEREVCIAMCILESVGRVIMEGSTTGSAMSLDSTRRCPSLGEL